jgi:hypothetical protein
MDRSIDEIYTSISQMVMKGISGSFSDAVLEVELHPLAMKLSGGYQRGDGSEPNAFIFIKEHKKILMNDLIELHLKTDLDEKSRWNTMNYSLHSSGEYRVEFDWNQELADMVEQVYAEA